MIQTIRIGTRRSKLALWQAHYVADLLTAGGFRPQLVPIETKGDKIQDVTLSKIGSKGVFTEELETQLLEGQIDLAVHSAKDLPSVLPDGYYILSICEREEPHDVIVAEYEINLDDPNLVLGTSSTRRVALLRHFYPHIRTVDVRGNLQTRMEKLRSNKMDGLVLAYAGVKRMEYDPMIRHWFDAAQFTPPVGQGAVAIEVHERLDSETANRIRALTNHPNSEQKILAERAFLREMEGGCSIPVFGLAQSGSDGQLTLTGGIASLDGKKLVRRTIHGEESELLGVRLAREVLSNGGAEILRELKG